MLTFLQAPINSTVDLANTLAETTTTQTEISALDFVLKGGVFMIPIFILLLITIYIAIERFLFIKRNSKVNNNMLNNIILLLNSGKIDAVNITLNQENTGLSRVIKEGTLSIGRPIPEIESNMERVASIEIGTMERKLGYLGLIAGIAPTLGFVGTISGVIKIFYNISISEDISIGNISGGLYEKMISSGSGLVVGLIAYAVYHTLNASIDNYLLNTQKAILNFINAIQRPNGN